MDIVVLKIGGAFLHDKKNSSLFTDIKDLCQSGKKFVLIHGGGPFITKALNDAGIESQFVDGQRVTSEREMPLIESVLSGQINKKLVREFLALDLNSAGISGVDQKLLFSELTQKNLGRVGEKPVVNNTYISKLMQDLDVLVVSPIGLASDGGSLNINADVAAMAIAKSLEVSKVFFISEGQGLLDDKGELITQITSKKIHELIERKIIHGGMVVKCQMIIDGLKNGIKEISLLNAHQLHALKRWYVGEYFGTSFILDEM